MRRRRWRRAVPPVLGVLAGTALLWLFVSSTGQEAVRAALEQRTGATARAQSVERLWLPPGVLIHDVELESAGLRLTAKEMEVRAAWLPLLWGEIRAGDVRLTDARLSLGDAGEASSAASRLPLGAAWQLNNIAVWTTQGGVEKQLLFIEKATWAPSLIQKSRLELNGSSDGSDSSRFHLVGEATAWRPPALPDGHLDLELEEFPAQPLLGRLVGSSRALAAARLNGKVSVDSEAGAARGEGVLRATAPEGTQLLSLDFRASGTPSLITLDSATGELAGNRIEATGTADGWQGSERKTELTLRLPDARLEDNTLDHIQAILGYRALAFAENVRGRYAAELKLAESAGHGRITGHADLNGLTYARKGMPTLNNIRGRLALSGERITFEQVTAKAFDTPTRITGYAGGDQLALHLVTEDVPAERILAEAAPDLKLAGLHGVVSLETDVTGPAERPTVAGRAHIRGVGFDLRQLPVRDVEGEATFGAELVRFESLHGRAGSCEARASGETRLVNWHDATVGEVTLPACDLPELARLAALAGIARLPGLQPEALDGRGTVAIGYARDRWRAEVMVPGARWSPAWLGSPLEDVRASVRVEPEVIQIRNLSGRFGSSPVSLRGQVGLLGAESAPWQMDLEAHLAPQDAEALVPAPWRQWVRILSEVEARGRLRGRPDGVTLDAQIQTNPTLTASVVPVAVPQAVRATIDLQARWNDEGFSLDRFSARFGRTEFSGRGSVEHGSEPQLNFHLQAPPGSAVEELLALVRLPGALQSVHGTAAVDLTLRGPVDKPRWAGSVDLEEVYLPDLLTDPLLLNGRLLLADEGLRLDSVRFIQSSDELSVNGLLRSQGPSTVEVAGTSVNVDRLLAQLPGEGLSMPQQDFLRDHPVQVDIALDRAQFLDLTFTDVHGRLEQSDGRLALTIPRFGLGPGHGRLEGVREPGSDQLRASLELNAIPTEMLLGDFLKTQRILTGPLDLHVELTGPVASRQEFLGNAHGLARFTINQGRIQKGTLPERLFALAALLREGPFGWGLLSLGKVWNPPNLRKFDTWSGTLELGEGKAQLVESNLVSNTYDVNLQGEVDMQGGTMQLHGEGNFHPPYQFDFSIKSAVEGLGRLFRLVRGRHGQKFEFDVAGELAGTKRIENFRFKD